MNFNELFTLARRALRANLMRTLLTMLGIVIGIASVIIIISIGQGATRAITNQVSSFGTNLMIIIPGAQSLNPSAPSAPTRTDTLTLNDAKALADKNRISNIDFVSPAIGQSAQVSANNVSQLANILGCQENYFEVNTLTPAQGSIFTEDDDASLAKVAFIGPEIAKNLFGENSDPVGQTISISNKNFRVIGVSAPKGSIGLSNPDRNVYIPLQTGAKFVFGREYLTVMIVRVTNPQLLEQTISDAKQVLLDQHKIIDPILADFTVTSSKDALATLNTVTGLLTGALAGIAAISLLVGGIGIMNIMLVTVTERTREIGLLKAIGAKRRDILAQILVESLVLTVIGGIAGIVIGIGVSYLITRAINVPLAISPLSILLAVGASSIIGIVFGLYPARRAARLNPIDALRFE